jgi:hypothetical protein
MKARRLAATAAASLALAGQAYAANPLHKDVCTEDPTTHSQFLDREKLALFILKDKAIGWQFGQWAQAQASAEEAARADALAEGLPAPPTMPFTSLAVRIMLCDTINVCTFDGKDKLVAGQFQLIDILNDRSGSFSNPQHASVTQFFTDERIAIQCLEKAPGKPVELAGSSPPPPELDLPIRLRGNVDSLMFLRGQPDFKAADKTTVSFTDDGINNKRSVKLVGVLGLSIPLIGGTSTADPNDPRPHPRPYASLELIPYVGINHDFSRVTGKDRTISANDWRFGAVLIGRRSASFGPGDTGWSLMNVVELRPELLFDDKTHAQIASVNFRYMPVSDKIFGLPIGLNAYRRILPDHDYFFSYRPILDFRFNNGTFTRQGDRLALEAKDFSRIGTQFGFAISHDNSRIPIDLIVTETYMVALAGYPRTLSQFKSVLSLSFDSNNYFGLDLAYVKGRREDLLAREDKWSIGFTARY